MTETPAAAMADDARDEFAYLPGQAAHLGTAVPAAERLRLDLPDGRVLSAVRLGAHRPRVVLLHGAGLNAHTWDTTSLSLEEAVLAVDLPGHGDSSWRDDADYRPRTLAPDVIRGIEAWTTGPVVLVGHSLGGLAAAAVAAARPDLVAALLLIDITPGAAGGSGSAELRRFYEETVFASREAVVERATAFGLGGALEDTRRGVFHNTRVRADGHVEWKHHFARLAQQALAAPMADSPAPLIDDSAWDDLASVAAPLTLVRATRGYIDDDAAAEFARRLPGAAVIELDAPHNVQEVVPGPLSALISSALRATGPALPPTTATTPVGAATAAPTADPA